MLTIKLSIIHSPPYSTQCTRETLRAREIMRDTYTLCRCVFVFQSNIRYVNLIFNSYYLSTTEAVHTKKLKYICVHKYKIFKIYSCKMCWFFNLN